MFQSGTALMSFFLFLFMCESSVKAQSVRSTRGGNDLSEPFCASSLKQSVWFRGFSLRIIFLNGHCLQIHFVKDPQCPRRGEALCGRLLYKTKWGARGHVRSKDHQKSCTKTQCVSLNSSETRCVNDAAFFHHSRRPKLFQKLRPNLLVASCCHISWWAFTNTNTITQCYLMYPVIIITWDYPRRTTLPGFDAALQLSTAMANIVPVMLPPTILQSVCPVHFRQLKMCNCVTRKHTTSPHFLPMGS